MKGRGDLPDQKTAVVAHFNHEARPQRRRVLRGEDAELPERLEDGAETGPLPLAVGDLEAHADAGAVALEREAVHALRSDLGDQAGPAGAHQLGAEAGPAPDPLR